MLHVAQFIDSLKIGGAQKLQVTYAQALPAQRVKVTVVALQDAHSPFRSELEAMGVRVLIFPAQTLLEPGRFWRLLSLIRRERFDILHAHLASANILVPLLGKLAGIPTIATLHGAKITMKRSSPLRAPLENWMLRRLASRVVAVGDSVADVYRPRLKGRSIDVIPNAVTPVSPLSPHERTDLRARLVGNPHRLVLISVGRLVREKGYTYLFRSIVQLREHYPDVRLLVVGDGGLKAELSSEVATLNLQQHVMLLGSRSDVPQLLAASDIFVSASISEGLPVATLEAMSAGLPVVATAVGEHPAVLGDGRGILVPAEDVEILTEALASLVEHADQRKALGCAAQEYVLRTYGISAWIRSTLTLYSELRSNVRLMEML